MKLNLLDRAVMAISPQRGVRRVRAKAVAEVLQAQVGYSQLQPAAKYDAAGNGRRGEWMRGPATSQNAENRMALTALRGRHRELVRNNGYASAAIDATVSLTVGDGLQPVARGGSAKKRKLAQSLMIEWARSVACDADGRVDLFGLQALVMREESEAGEVLAMRRIKRIPGVRVPLQIRVLEADFLDHLRDGQIDGRRVVQGVAFAGDNDRHGYYIHRHHPGDGAATLSASQLVLASEIAHIYEVRRAGQVRGVPRASAVMTRVDGVDKFQDARREQQMIAACLALIIQQGEEGKAAGDVLPDKMEPGLVARLGQDESAVAITPPSVSGQGEFVRGEEHVIAKGYGLNHQVLTGDISQANFAASKVGRLDVYGNVGRWRRNMLVPQFCKRVEAWFIEAADMAGHDLSGVTFDWVPPRSEILNLRDDIPALIKQARGGFGSLFALLRSLGYPDPKEVLLEIKEVNDFLDEHEIVLDSDPRKITSGGQVQVGTPPRFDDEEDPIDEDDA